MASSNQRNARYMRKRPNRTLRLMALAAILVIICTLVIIGGYSIVSNLTQPRATPSFPITQDSPTPTPEITNTPIPLPTPEMTDGQFDGTEDPDTTQGDVLEETPDNFTTTRKPSPSPTKTPAKTSTPKPTKKPTPTPDEGDLTTQSPTDEPSDPTDHPTEKPTDKPEETPNQPTEGLD